MSARTELDMLRDAMRLMEEEELLRLRHRARRNDDPELAQMLLGEFNKRETREESLQRGEVLRALLQRSFYTKRVE